MHDHREVPVGLNSTAVAPISSLTIREAASTEISADFGCSGTRSRPDRATRRWSRFRLERWSRYRRTLWRTALTVPATEPNTRWALRSFQSVLVSYSVIGL
jgi:hypothetical protein